MYRSFTSLVKIIPTYFILFAIIINRIICLNFSFCLLLVYRNATYCCVLILYPATLLRVLLVLMVLVVVVCLLFVLGEGFGGVFRVSYV